MKSTVWFARLPEKSTIERRIAATDTVLKQCRIERVLEKNDRTAVKIHVGEKNNATHVAPDIVRTVVARIRELGASPFLTETSTLYKGERSNGIDHLIHAFSHGFTYEKVGAPFIMADGLFGNTEIEIPIPGSLYKKVNIAREVVFADSLVALSHPTGHMGMALGACLKNLGMGLSSRMGKLRQHSTIKPYVADSKCTFCLKCFKWCPVDAIVEKQGKAFIVSDRCIGCGQCLAVCRFDAVRYNWGVESVQLQKNVAEHALGVIIDKKEKSLFLNFLFDMTRNCDCMGEKQEAIQSDVGILASCDPVAIDQATLDLTHQRFGKSLAEASWPALDATVQLEHAESIGLGSCRYELLQCPENS